MTGRGPAPSAGPCAEPSVRPSWSRPGTVASVRRPPAAGRVPGPLARVPIRVTVSAKPSDRDSAGVAGGRPGSLTARQIMCQPERRAGDSDSDSDAAGPCQPERQPETGGVTKLASRTRYSVNLSDRNHRRCTLAGTVADGAAATLGASRLITGNLKVTVRVTVTSSYCRLEFSGYVSERAREPMCMAGMRRKFCTTNASDALININKLCVRLGLCSRREANEFVSRGLVSCLIPLIDKCLSESHCIRSISRLRSMEM